MENYPHLSLLPDDREAARIIQLIQQRRQALSEVEKELKDARIDHEILQQQHNQCTDDSLDHGKEDRVDLEASAERIKQLEGKETQIRTDLGALLGPLHPIRRCSTDVLQEIFEWVVLTEEFTLWLQKATILSHVCERWRLASISIPSLWSDVAVSLAFPNSSQLLPRNASLESLSGSSSPSSTSQSSVESLIPSQPRPTLQSELQTTSRSPGNVRPRFRSPQSIEDYWSRTVERVRGSTAWVYIEEFSDDPEVLEGLKKCRFDLLPNIQYLQFWLKTNSAAVNLTTCELHIHSNSSSHPDGSKASDKDHAQTRNCIRHLKIETCWQTPASEQILRVDPTILINRFAAANLEIVELGDFDFENFRSDSCSNLKGYKDNTGYVGEMRNAVFPRVLNITINNSWNVPLDLLSKTFPNATKVRLVDIKFRSPKDWPYIKSIDNEGKEGMEYIVWPEAVTFTATSAEHLALRRLKLPKVTYIDLPGVTSNISENQLNPKDAMRVGNGVFTEFLAAHPTLLHLHTRNLAGCGLGMARNASQLICLSIPATEAANILEFPNLTSLRLFQRKSGEISAELFEKIVRKHFLPAQTQAPRAPIGNSSSKLFQKLQSTHAQSIAGDVDRDLQEKWWRCREPWERWERKLNDKDHPYPVLTILIPSGENFVLYWREHALTACAVSAVTEEALRRDKFKAYSFRWE